MLIVVSRLFFNNCILFHYVNISQFIHPIDAYLAPFLFFAITNRAIVYILIHISLCTHETLSRVLYIYVKLLDHRAQHFWPHNAKPLTRGCASFHSFLQCKAVPRLPLLLNWYSQNFTFFINLMGIKWYCMFVVLLKLQMKSSNFLYILAIWATYLTYLLPLPSHPY